MSTESLETCLVIDAGRFGASRITNIASGWAEAFRRAADANPFPLPVAGSIMTAAELVAGAAPFAEVPAGARESADAIGKAGHLLASRRGSDLLESDESATFAKALAQSCAALAKEAPAGPRRLIAIYRQAFGEPGNPDERMILQGLSTVSERNVMALLIGPRLSGAHAGCVRPWLLPTEALRSPATVGVHAWSVLDRCTSEWWESAPRHPSARAATESRGVRLTCDSCGSVTEGCEVGDHCPVCHMGHARASAHAR